MGERSHSRKFPWPRHPPPKPSPTWPLDGVPRRVVLSLGRSHALRQKTAQTEMPKNQTNVAIHPTVRISPRRTMAAGAAMNFCSFMSQDDMRV
jgi:hypothetical protein